MYCPKCATQNSDDTKFCRQCGGNISLVLEAMGGDLPQGRAVGWDAAGYPYDAQGRRIDQGPATIGHGVRDISRGALSLIGIVIVQVLTDWPLWWLLFVVPQSIYFLSEGIGKVVQVKHGSKERNSQTLTESEMREMVGNEGYRQISGQSITERTTRELEATKD